MTKLGKLSKIKKHNENIKARRNNVEKNNEKAKATQNIETNKETIMNHILNNETHEKRQENIMNIKEFIVIVHSIFSNRP